LPIGLASRARQSWSKNENTPTLRASPRRTPHPNQKISFLIEPRRLAASVEGLNNSLAIAAGELYLKKPRANLLMRAVVKGLSGVFLYAKSVCRQCHPTLKFWGGKKIFWGGQNVEF